jgi:competence protein ComEC
LNNQAGCDVLAAVQRHISLLARPIGLAAMAAAATLTVLPGASARVKRVAPTPAKIIYVNVGQGDAVVMRIGGRIIVSDAGEHRVENVDEALRSLGATQIDVALLSHPHDDHVQNFTDLLRRFGWKIKQAVLTQSKHWRGTKANRKLMNTLAERDVLLRFVAAGDSFGWGGASWRILSPRRGEFIGGAKEAANASVVYLLTVNDVTVLFTGDIEPNVAKWVAVRWAIDRLEAVDIFLATHHGSKHGSVKELVEEVRPRWAVLSTGPNSFEHPSPEAILRLQKARASIWCTAVNGSVTARISAAGRLTWRASLQRAPWWSARAKRKTGSCVGR